MSRARQVTASTFFRGAAALGFSRFAPNVGGLGERTVDGRDYSRGPGRVVGARAIDRTGALGTAGQRRGVIRRGTAITLLHHQACGRVAPAQHGRTQRTGTAGAACCAACAGRGYLGRTASSRGADELRRTAPRRERPRRHRQPAPPLRRPRLPRAPGATWYSSAASPAARTPTASRGKSMRRAFR